MRKFLVLMVLGLAFIACDYAKEAVELNPDIEITWINPIGWYTSPGDTTSFATISEVDFVPENSLDAYLTSLTVEYVDMYDNVVMRTQPFPLYAKVEGIVERPYVDTTKILNLMIPLDTAVTYMVSNDQNSIKALLHFEFTDELFSTYDTATVWFGIYMFE